MSEVIIQGSGLTTQLQSLLDSDGIEPGTDPSYQLCKTIYLYHPLGAKMVDGPINVAQSQQRIIEVNDSPEERVKKAFLDEWKKLNCTNLIFNTMVLSRVYGISSIVVGAKGVPPGRPLDYPTLAEADLYFNVLDPLNTSGSLVLNQNPNSPSFQKGTSVSVAGIPYHPSRSCIIMNGEPIYISFTTSAFGYVGRSVYQRVVYPLKSFVESMRTDDLVTQKAGVLVAKMRTPASAVTNLMQKMAGVKRNFLKGAKTGNVISVDREDSIESIDLKNADTAMSVARKNILENIATGADMPAKILNAETFAEGFGEGTEDAKVVARFVEGIREEMAPLYDFFDKIVMYRAWNRAFYKTIQAEFPEWKDVGYTEAFYRWCNSFTATWPSLLIEPESEQVKVEETKFKAINDLLANLLGVLDPENKAALIQWAADNLNEQKLMFTAPLVFDLDALINYVPPTDTAAPDAEPVKGGSGGSAD